MFRFAVAAGCAQLVAGARTQEISGDLSLHEIQHHQHDSLSAVENSNSTTYCPYASGFTAHEGKCTGQFVADWANGEYANYGQDSNGHIHGLADAAYRCRQHWDCSGFYTREGVGYSHWRTGRFAVNPNPGHCCYRKVGGGSNLLEVNEFENADAEGAMVATQGEAQPQRCDAGRTCPTYDHCHPVSYGAYGCGFQCTRQGGHGSYLCNNHCAGCNYVSLLELSPSLMELSANENADAKGEGTSTQPSRGGSCQEVSGFTVNPGRCEGSIERTTQRFGRQEAVEPAAGNCREHSGCSGFSFKSWTGGSAGDIWWNTGHIFIRPRPGFCCYQKLNSALMELSANENENADAKGEGTSTQCGSRTCYGDEQCCGAYTMSPQCLRRGQSCCTWHRAATALNPGETCCGSGGPGASSYAHACYAPTPPPPPPPSRGGSCQEVSGFTVNPGRCEGSNDAYFGLQEAVGPAAGNCREHSGCSGFSFNSWSGGGAGDIYWNTGHIFIRPRPGYCCSQKLNSALLELSDESKHADAEVTPGADLDGLDCAGHVRYAFEQGKNQPWASNAYATMLEETHRDFHDATLDDFHRFFYCGGVPDTRCAAPPRTCSSPPCDVCSAGNAESADMPPPASPAPQAPQVERTGSGPCLCLFDIDRTLTGKQGELGRCPRNQQTDAWDTAYSQGQLVLSELGQDIMSSQCGQCYIGAISAGPASGGHSDERAKLLELIPAEKRMNGGFVDGCPSPVSGPLVLSCHYKPRPARDIVNWFRGQGVSIADDNVFFFDDKHPEVASFQGSGFNARQVSCASRDGSRGLCGGVPDEANLGTGVHFC